MFFFEWRFFSLLVLLRNVFSNLSSHRGEAEKHNCLCHLCGEVQANPSRLKIHLANHQLTDEFTCSTCGKAFKDLPRLRRHELLHVDTPRFNCPICSTTFKRKDNMHQHIKKAHGEEHLPYQLLKYKKYDCEICSMSFKREDQLLQHLEEIHDEHKFSCPICNRSFKRRCQGRAYILLFSVTILFHFF